MTSRWNTLKPYISERSRKLWRTGHCERWLNRTREVASSGPSPPTPHSTSPQPPSPRWARHTAGWSAILCEKQLLKKHNTEISRMVCSFVIVPSCKPYTHTHTQSCKAVLFHLTHNRCRRILMILGQASTVQMKEQQQVKSSDCGGSPLDSGHLVNVFSVHSQEHEWHTAARRHTRANCDYERFSDLDLLPVSATAKKECRVNGPNQHNSSGALGSICNIFLGSVFLFFQGWGWGSGVVRGSGEVCCCLISGLIMDVTAESPGPLPSVWILKRTIQHLFCL